MHCSGCRPFSKRPDASLRRPSAHEVRWMFGPLHVATSSSTRVVPSRTSERAPPISPAIEVGPSASSITTISRVERARLAVERLHLLALPCAADRQPRPGDAVEVEGVQRLAAEQHRVVSDVDDVVDRALPGRRQPRLQPRRGRRERDVLEDPRGEARAEIGALHADRGCGQRRRASPGPRSTVRARAARRSRRAARARRRRRRGSPAGWG